MDGRLRFETLRGEGRGDLKHVLASVQETADAMVHAGGLGAQGLRLLCKRLILNSLGKSGFLHPSMRLD